jgi:hypothetical protein
MHTLTQVDLTSNPDILPSSLFSPAAVSTLDEATAATAPQDPFQSPDFSGVGGAPFTPSPLSQPFDTSHLPLSLTFPSLPTHSASSQQSLIGLYQKHVRDVSSSQDHSRLLAFVNVRGLSTPLVSITNYTSTLGITVRTVNHVVCHDAEPGRQHELDGPGQSVPLVTSCLVLGESSVLN